MSRSTENLLAPTWITDLQEFRLGLLLAKAKACLKMFLKIKYSEFVTYNKLISKRVCMRKLAQDWPWTV